MTQHNGGNGNGNGKPHPVPLSPGAAAVKRLVESGEPLPDITVPEPGGASIIREGAEALTSAKAASRRLLQRLR